MSDKRFQKKLARMKRRGEHWKQEKELCDAYAEYVPERKKKKVSNIMLVVVVIAIITYTAANFWLTYTTGTSMDSTITTCFYAFWSSEVLSLMGIKISKVIKNQNDVDSEFERLQEEVANDSDE